MKIKQKITNIFQYLSALFLFAVPFFVSAQNAVQQGLRTQGLGGLFGTSGGSLSGATNLNQLIINVIEIALAFAGGIAIIFVIIGGYQYITSAGNEESAEKGRKTLTNAIIGIIIIVLSYAIINTISGLVSTNQGNGIY